MRFCTLTRQQIQRLAAKFPTQQDREFLRRNREFAHENREFERALEQSDFRMIFSEGTRSFAWHLRSSDRCTFTLAERICGALDRLNPPGMPRPNCCYRRSRFFRCMALATRSVTKTVPCRINRRGAC